MKRHREEDESHGRAEERSVGVEARARGTKSDDSEAPAAVVVELRCLTDATPELVKQVRKLNLGVLPVQPPEFCYKRAVRDAKELSWAATTTIELQSDGENASNKSAVSGAIVAEYEPLNRAVHVRTLAVEPRCRRQGIGRQLIQKVVAQAQLLRRQGDDAAACESVRLHVHAGNADGIAFYERAGFTQEARLENYYRHLEPHACLVLSYALPVAVSNGDDEKDEQESD